jgi:hypothetical protein
MAAGIIDPTKVCSRRKQSSLDHLVESVLAFERASCQIHINQGLLCFLWK